MNDIFDDVDTAIFDDEPEKNSPDEREKYLNCLKYIARSQNGKTVLASLLKKFRLFKLSSGGVTEITSRREGVRSCGLLIFEDLKEVAMEELEQIISMTI